MKYNKIAFSSTHSCGKTTIVELLKGIRSIKKDYKIYTNVSRTLSKDGAALNNSSTFEGQIYFMGHRAMELAQEMFICDRSIYDVMAYSLTSDKINKSEKKVLLSIFKKLYKKYDVLFYIPIEFAEVKDDVRPGNEKYRELIRDTIEGLIEKYPPKKIVIVKGTVEERLETVLKELKEW